MHALYYVILIFDRMREKMWPSASMHLGMTAGWTRRRQHGSRRLYNHLTAFFDSAYVPREPHPIGSSFRHIPRMKLKMSDAEI